MRILIVEDDTDIREFLKNGLEAELFSVDVADDGEKGAYLARTNDYDVVLLDNMMPKMSGAEVCQDIRNHGKTMPIIMLSVQTESLQKIDILNAGADDYVTKPFSFGELVARIRAVLRRPRTYQGEILQIDDLVLDLGKHKAQRGQQDVYLTRKEFELLEYLMRNQGRVLSRSMITEHIWDVNADPFSNTIETHILNLRRKIDQKASRPLIQTVPGRGYKIDFNR